MPGPAILLRMCGVTRPRTTRKGKLRLAATFPAPLRTATVRAFTLAVSMMKATEKNYVMKSKSKKEVPDDREKRKNERNKKLSLEQGCGSGFTWIQEGQFEGKN